MNVYKKVFHYVPEKIVPGILSILTSLLSGVILVYAYMLLYFFLENLILFRDEGQSYAMSLKIVLALTLAGLCYLFSGVLSHIFAFRLETNLRKKGIEGLASASFRFYDLHSSGYIRKTIDSNAEKTHQAVAHMIPDSAQAFLVPLLTLALGFFVSIRVGVILLLLVLVSGFFLQKMMGGSQFMKLYQESLNHLSGETVEYVRGIQVVKLFGNRLQSFKAMKKAIESYAKYAYEYSLSCKTPYVLYQWIFLGLIPILSIPLSFLLVKEPQPEKLIIDLIMIFFLDGVIMVAFMKIMWSGMYIFNASFAIDEMEKLYKEMQEDSLQYGKEENFPNYSMESQDVDFSYGDKKVLEGLSFRLEEGKSYALVGHSGSGKSTIAKLFSGFYKADKGQIRIGDLPIESYSKNALCKAISFVFQDSKLFHKTIYENVLLGKPGATPEEVHHALDMAGCREILERFPEKENTLIGAKGVYLSGGEKQRIAIARAILKNAPIVILDEASASIDADQEYALQNAFKNLIQGKTVIMIAHRLSSIQGLHEILVLEEGRIVERGSSKELLQKDSRYKKLWELYQTTEDWRINK
ncbi:ABC transporter ATP-binding protein [Oribacterium sp.]